MPDKTSVAKLSCDNWTQSQGGSTVHPNFCTLIANFEVDVRSLELKPPTFSLESYKIFRIFLGVTSQNQKVRKKSFKENLENFIKFGLEFPILNSKFHSQFRIFLLEFQS